MLAVKTHEIKKTREKSFMKKPFMTLKLSLSEQFTLVNFDHVKILLKQKWRKIFEPDQL